MFLEIGLWQTIEANTAIALEATVREKKQRGEEGETPQTIYKRLLKQAEGRLGHRCGERFRELTIQCLKGAAGEAFEDEEQGRDKLMVGLQEKFRRVVVRPLLELADTVGK